MNPVEELVHNFQELVAQVPALVQPFVVMLAAVVPFIEGEVASLIGVVGGLHPVVAGIAAAAGNFICVLLVVLFGSRARSAVIRGRSPEAVAAGGAGTVAIEDASTKPESKGRQRVKQWLVRFGVPGASILGPLAIPTQFTTALLIAGGTPRGWVLLWQGVAIVLWTTLAVVSSWAALTYVVGV